MLPCTLISNWTSGVVILTLIGVFNSILKGHSPIFLILLSMHVLKITLEAIFVIFLVDFISGLVHWAEDTFWTERTPVVGKWIVKPNVIHHEQPNAFTTNNWWQSSWDLFLTGVVIIVVTWLTGTLTWHVWLFCIIGSNANQLHKYAHMNKAKVPGIVLFLQHVRVLQTARQHANHHTGEKNTAYCVVTPYLNPVLDKIRFWRFLEFITVPLLGAPRREDLRKSE